MMINQSSDEPVQLALLDFALAIESGCLVHPVVA